MTTTAVVQSWIPVNHEDNMETNPDAMQVMMRLSAAKNRAKTAQDRAIFNQVIENGRC